MKNEDLFFVSEARIMGGGVDEVDDLRERSNRNSAGKIYPNDGENNKSGVPRNETDGSEADLNVDKSFGESSELGCKVDREELRFVREIIVGIVTHDKATKQCGYNTGTSGSFGGHVCDESEHFNEKRSHQVILNDKIPMLQDERC